MTNPRALAEIRAQRDDTPERRHAIAGERQNLEAEIALHELREHRGVSQATLAKQLAVSRPRVSTIERAGEDLRVSTVARYVAALGGSMRIVATFDGEEVEVTL
jgi:DNA-binding XRE family transcriptional regulator